MVSANIPEQWLSNATILRLTDRAYRHHAVLLTWSVSNRTNGFIPGDIALLQTGISDDGVGEVEAAGLLERDGSGWRLTQYDRTQSSAEMIESSLANLRKASRESSRRHREKRKAEQGSSTDGDVTVTSPPESKAKESKAGKSKSLDNRSSSSRSEVQDTENRTDSTLAGEDRLVSGVEDDQGWEAMNSSRSMFDPEPRDGLDPGELVGWTAEVVKPGEGRVNEVTGEIAAAVPLLPSGVRPCVRRGCDRARAAGNLNCSEHASAGTVLESSRWGEVS